MWPAKSVGCGRLGSLCRGLSMLYLRLRQGLFDGEWGPQGLPEWEARRRPAGEGAVVGLARWW